MIRTFVTLDTALPEYKEYTRKVTPFSIPPMPQAPRVEDMINLKSILSSDYSVIPNALWDLHWMAHIIEWDLDQEGYFVRLTLLGQ